MSTYYQSLTLICVGAFPVQGVGQALTFSSPHTHTSNCPLSAGIMSILCIVLCGFRCWGGTVSLGLWCASGGSIKATGETSWRLCEWISHRPIWWSSQSVSYPGPSLIKYYRNDPQSNVTGPNNSMGVYLVVSLATYMRKIISQLNMEKCLSVLLSIILSVILSVLLIFRVFWVFVSFYSSVDIVTVLKKTQRSAILTET